MFHLIPCLWHMCTFPDFHWICTTCQNCMRTDVSLAGTQTSSMRFVIEISSGSILRAPVVSPHSDWCLLGVTLATLPTVCTYSKSLHITPSHSPCFTPASGQSWTWSIISSIGGVLHFKAACSPFFTTNTKWTDPPFSFTSWKTFYQSHQKCRHSFSLTTQGCGSEGFVYRGVHICRHTVTCPWLGGNLNPMQSDRQGLLVWGEARLQKSLHVTVTLCVK